MSVLSYEKPAIMEETVLEKELFFSCLMNNPKKCEPVCRNPGQSTGEPC